MTTLQNRHDLTDDQWEKIAPVIKKSLDNRGGSNANDDRTFVNG